ncbi:MAG TPA: lysylphosphatidylglycerol synthase transmembrane domain-containing protein, partial [Acidimicrobiales bacterium]
IIFAPAGDGSTRRRASDAFRLGLAVVIVVVGSVIVRADSSPELRLESFLHAAPQGISWLVTTVWYAGSLGVIVGLLLLALVMGRAAVARNAALAGGLAWLACGIAGWVLGPDGGRAPVDGLQGVNQGYPVARMAATIAVACVTLPYLNRAWRRLVVVLVALASVATVVNGAGLPFNVLVGLALGWGVAAAVHLIFGSPLGLPSPFEVGDSLADLGVEMRDIVAAPDQVWGVARYSGRGDGGLKLDVSVYGRDASSAQLLAKVWRFFVYRDSGPTLQLSRLQQVEHEAYLTLLAGHLGVAAPTIVASGIGGPGHDALLVTDPPPGRHFADLEADEVSDAALDAALSTMLELRRADVVHGGISPRTLVLDDEGSVGLTDFRKASSGAPARRLDLDLAGALASCALVAGADRTAEAAHRVLDPPTIEAVLVCLQPAGLDPAVIKALHRDKELLKTLRQQCAAKVGVELPELTELKRVSVTNLVLIVGSIIGIWALIGVLSDVSSSLSTLEGADWGWVAVVFVFGQLPNFARAWALTGAVPGDMPLGAVTQLQFANNFTALVGGSMGTLAMTIRFFQRRGYDAAVAIGAGVLNSTVSWVVKGLLFLISLPFALGSLDFGSKDTETGGHGDTVWIVLAVVVGVGVLAGAVWFIPKIRHLAASKVKPHVVAAWDDLKTLAHQPRKLVAVFLGNIGAQLFTALALGAALHAFGTSLSLPILFVVITLASMVGAVSPVPGGMGLVEAGMIAGLAAAGVPQNVAVAAVFTQRLFTAYLPPIWGWFILIWMRRKELI